MEKEQLAGLAKKYMDGSATVEEMRLLHEWYDAANEDETVMIPLTVLKSMEEMKKRGFLEIQKTINGDSFLPLPLHETTEQPRSIRLPGLMKFAAAAAILLLVSFAVYLWPDRSTVRQKVLAEMPEKDNQDTPPGCDKAQLVMDDGSVVILEDATNGVIKKEAGIEVTKQNGELIFKAPAQTEKETAISFNTLSTPRGGQYQLLLPDGSKVWLNAASSLRFPSAFRGKLRQVELTGEAYFEIAKNAAMPFRVSVNDMQVEVLGTHFNIMSYADEKDINTTLLEGSVKVIDGGVTRLLKPGDQATLNKAEHDISIAKVDVEQAIAWKNGLFQFEGVTLETVMKQLARWYNLEVIYKGNFSAHFRGMISRSANISQVIRMLEMTGEVHFKIEGKTITVMP